MDDAYLAKLTVNQPGLKPDFKKEIYNYEIHVASNVSVLNVAAETSDRGASFSIKSSSGYGEECKLSDGENKIQIECTSEDGTIKKYFINCFKLASSFAQLNSLEIKDLILKPKFDSNLFDYETRVKFAQKEIEIKASVIDPNCVIEINCNGKPVAKINEVYLCTLNYGLSEIITKLTSPDKTKEQVYKVNIKRDAFPRICSFSNLKEKIEMEDPISLAPLYQATKLIFDNKIEINYSLPFLSLFQRVSSSDDLLNFISLSAHNSSKYPKMFNLDLENKLSDSLVCVPLLNGKLSDKFQLKMISDQIEALNQEDQLANVGDDVKKYVPNHVDNMVESLPAYQVKPWEKFLQIIYDETDAEKLIKYSDDHLDSFFNFLTKTEPENIIKNSGNDDSPLYFLNMSIFNLTTSFKFKSRSYQTHLKLAHLLEEKYLYENLYGPDLKDDTSNSAALSLCSQNKLAIDSSKEEEISAICQQRKYWPNPTDAQKLKALDEEYHYLIGSGQNVKAEQIQLLYQFKAKKIGSNPGHQLSKLSETGDYLLKANLKYLDAMSLVLESKQSNFALNLQLARSYCMIGEYTQTMIYLKPCLDWSDTQNQTLTRLYFAYAMSKFRNLVESYSKVIISYLCSGLQLFLSKLTQCITNRSALFACDQFSILQTVFLEAFLIVGKLKAEFHDKNADFISAENAFRYCAWLSCVALEELSSRTVLDTSVVSKSPLIQTIYQHLVESHINLITYKFSSVFMFLSDKEQIEEYRLCQSKQCIVLLNLIRFLPVYKSSESFLKQQENIGQILAFTNPLDSYSLIQLAWAKLELYDFYVETKIEREQLDELILECKNLLLVCLELMDEKSNTNVSPLITDQKWWSKTVDDLKAKIKSTLKKPEAPARVQTPINNANNKAKNTPVAAAKPVAKPAPPTNASNIKKGVAPASKPAANQKQQAVPAKLQAPSKQETKPSVPEVQPIGSSNESNDKVDEVVSLFLKYTKKPSVYSSEIIYMQSQLCLARVYARLKDFKESKLFYDKVIQKEPKKHDAYIELANMLRDNDDIPGAIDVYSSFPANENSKEKLNYDDAFIFGELVNMLFNSQKYDDPRLVKYLILWAQVMGIGVIDKYIATLDKANKTNACKQVYAGVHKKQLNDPDLNQFFKFKGWL